MSLDYRLRDGETQARPSGGSIARRVAPIEALEHVRKILARDPGTGILEPDGGPAVHRENAPALLGAGCVLQRVLGQVVHDPPERFGIGVDGDPGLDLTRLGHAARAQAELVQRLVEEGVQLESLALWRRPRF